MSHFKTSYHDFVQSAFSPMVAVMCSPLVDDICRKNNLSFSELVQPFCKLTTEANLRDPSGTTITIKNFRINISDVNSRPPQPTMARKFLNESVSLNTSERTTNLDIGGMSIDVPVSTPWYDAWRDTFLDVQFPSDHEFTKHYLACLLVVSSKETSPLDLFTQMGSQLQQMQTISPAKLPKWFSTSVLRYHVLLHDNIDGDTPLAESLFETMKTSYGVSNVFFLNINSQVAQTSEGHLPDPWSQFLARKVQSQEVNEADLDVSRNHLEGLNIVETAQEAGETSPSTPIIMHPLSPVSDQNVNNAFDKTGVDGVTSNSWPVVHGGCLTAEDLEKLREFISCFCLSCLIPHVENQIQQLTEMISNKKGMSRSFLSATKRWFGSNKPGVPNSPTANVTYTNDSTELQLRRLGDMCFMFGAYSLAFSAYHAAKRDFNADTAWLYYAGALEMAALSLYMQPTDPTRKAHDYAEESILTYQNSCRLPQFATRATIFSAECLRGRGLYGEAAKQLIRMTSEDSDLRSALLLEQAAYCFLASARPLMPRKYAFHLVLAGHRYCKAGQKKHSLRCYRQAYQVYENKNWSLAEDHIHHTIGRQASLLQQMTEASEAFALLLPRASRQSAAQQTAFLKEYITTQQQLNSETGELPTLPVPVVDNDSIQVLLGKPPTPSLSESSFTFASGVSFDLQPDEAHRWNKMEEELVTAAARSQPMIFKPTLELLNNSTNNANSPTSYVGETISVSVSLNNPLHISLTLQSVRLLWSFIPGSGLCQDNSQDNNSSAANTHVIERLVIQPDSSCKVILQVTPLEVGELRVTGLAYQLEGEGGGGSVGGRQLLLPRGPRLRSTKDRRPEDNSVFAVDNRLKLNIAQFAPALRVSFEGLRKDMLSGELTSVSVNFENCGNLNVTRLLLTCATPNIVSLGHRSGEVMEVPLDSPLAPNCSVKAPMQLRAHHLKGSFSVDLLFYYESVQNQNKPLYRLVRHSWPILVHDSLQVTVTPTRSSVVHETEETLNLRLQVHNTSQVHDTVKCVMCVECAALHSPHWQLNDRGFHPAAVPLSPQELAHFLVKVRRKNKPGTGEVSRLPLAEGTSLTPFTDFLPHVGEETDVEENSLQSVVALQAIFIVMWRATIDMRGGDSRVAVGQHHVTLRWLGESSSWPPSAPTTTPSPSTSLRIFGEEALSPGPTDDSVVRQRLVTFSVVNQHITPHDFTTNRVCVVPVDLLVRNCSDCELVVQIEASGATVSNKGYMYFPHLCHLFHWVGGTRRLVSLLPHHTHCVKLSVAVGMPGAYDLGSHLVVRARRPVDDNFTTQTWRSDSILVVT